MALLRQWLHWAGTPFFLVDVDISAVPYETLVDINCCEEGVVIFRQLLVEVAENFLLTHFAAVADNHEPKQNITNAFTTPLKEKQISKNSKKWNQNFWKNRNGLYFFYFRHKKIVYEVYKICTILTFSKKSIIFFFSKTYQLLNFWGRKRICVNE